jgi:ribonuclease HI
VCYTDGGYKQSREPKGYGSFAIYKENNLIELVHFDLSESKTSNESEYLSLITLLRFLEKNYKSENSFIYMDSRLVYNQVGNGWKVRAENLKDYNTIALGIKKILDVRLIWIGRKEILKVLGH